ncbi:Transcription factor 25 [Halotydeus destructor]|nr:Transcription factor 25 [Halotydeus destructor]
MSNRMFRKLRGDETLELTEGLDDTLVNSSEEEQLVDSVRNKKVNRFDLLLEGDEPAEVCDQDDSEENQESVGNLIQQSTNDSESVKRKKKKKKKSRKGVTTPGHDETDDIDATLREVDELLGPLRDESAENVKVNQSRINLIRIENRYLNSENEMKRIFGSRVVQSESNSRQRRPKGRAALTRSWLMVNPVKYHNLGRPSITMEISSKVDDLVYFDFVHSRQYQLIQFQFLDAVESFNPENILQLINQHPCHIESLIQFSDVIKTDDAQMAGELLERAIYCFEAVFHTGFNVASGNCRVSYKRPENRTFFISLFKHLTFIGQRGCYRTALEFCKVLLNLDPEGDPLCVLLMMDFYALQSGQYDFLIQLYEEWNPIKKLSLLPNYRFSVALAMYFKSRYGSDEEMAAKATEHLVEALIMFPTVLSQILDKCSIEPDKQVSSCSFFASNAPMPQAVEHLVSLYAGRTYLLWKEKEVLLWLERTVRSVVQSISSRDTAIIKLQNQSSELRKKFYTQGTPRNVLRHIVLSGIKDASAALPPDVTGSAIYGFDPLPPTDSVASYARPERSRVTGPASQSGLLNLFLRSWMPDFNAETHQRAPLGDEPELDNDGQENRAQERPLGRPPPQAEAAAAANGDNGNDFRRGVTTLMDAMRDLLNNVNMADPEVANIVQDDVSDDSDDGHVGQFD